MSVRALHAELNAVRALVGDGLAEVTGAAGDPGQFWIRSACARLTALDGVLVEAAGGLATPVIAAAATVVSFGAVALSAALAQAAGLSGIAVLVVVGLVLVTLLGAASRMSRRLRVALGRRRLDRAGTPPLGARPHDASAHVGLIVVPDALLRARVRLVSATLRQAGSRHWTVPELRTAARTDPLRRLAHADLLLCQAIDCLERYLDDLAKEWP
ncbi:hypothetical protein [Actinoplanes aureus]|uniref:Uncharacterized protein n=1 Tax=Actinoplanes aureus TaxID=2792083 RepID=A0A931FVC0_9ACTN|nr:hypothetical protein [Actinoplanes aureus]MBG0560100.1 hypothetical protein [Actinoplanes aureus]